MNHPFAHFPMGPNLRHWLGLSDQDYQGFKTEKPTLQQQAEFTAYLSEYATGAAAPSLAQASQIVDELVGMDLPLAALKMIDCQSDWDRLDFQRANAEGVAAMLAGEWARAEMGFRFAQNAAPDEPAPYGNIAAIKAQDRLFSEAEEWLARGLAVAPNHFHFWEVAGFLSQQDEGFDLPGLVQRFHSWAGASLLADMTETANPALKWQHLHPFYQEGERSKEFLIEYTGACGQGGDYQAIETVVWQTPKPLPWQIHLHWVQALIAQEKKDKFVEEANKLVLDPRLPAGITAELKTLILDQ